MKTGFGSVVFVLALGTLLGACGSSSDTKAILRIDSMPNAIKPDGSKTTLTVTAIDASGKPGTGNVQVSAQAGSLNDGAANGNLTLASDGTAKVTFACDASKDAAGCQGRVSITAVWNGQTAIIEISLGGSVQVTPDAGSPDGGLTDAGMNPTDAGSSSSSGTLSLQASRATIYKSTGDISVITATTFTADGGVASGQTVNLVTTLGTFEFSDGGHGPNATLQTGGNGMGSVPFTDTGTAGVATITATEPSSGSSTVIAVNIGSVQQIVFVDTVCNSGPNCALMGLKNSGFNESANVKFRVLDASNQPVSGVQVAFSIASPPLGVTVSQSGTTDASGNVAANVSSGSATGSFSVHAVVIPGQVEVNSTTIGIGGGIPTSKGFTLQCTQANIPAYISNQPPADLNVACKLSVIDRLGAPIGTGTAVSLETEAGRVPANVQLARFDPNSPTAPGQGTASFTFSTLGALPLDVAPFAANPSQLPFPLEAEPPITSGAQTRNPRDGLVTIIAYVKGEEWFNDGNNNGVWDPGEQFIDQGEPFVDENDNNVWDLGEPYVDVNQNGSYDGPNGVHDSSSTVWTQTHILYTGFPTNSRIKGAAGFGDSSNNCSAGGGLALGATATMQAYLADLNLNLPSAGTSVNVTLNPTTGGVTVGMGAGAGITTVDEFGFGLDNFELVSSTDGSECVPSTPICVYKTLFSTWRAGRVPDVQLVNNRTNTATVSCVSQSVLLNYTEGAQTGFTSLNGYLQ